LAATRRQAARVPDRFEAEQLVFFERVRAAYLERSQADPARVVRIDGGESMVAIRTVLRQDLLAFWQGGD
jgi:dTMP kinase